jgi:NADH-quinone oxidoreductase subunit L
VAQIALAVLLFPAAGAVVLGLGALRLPRRAVQVIGPGVVWASFLLVVYLFWHSLSHPQPLNLTYWTWVRSGGFQVPANIYLDRLAIFMGLVITGVGGLIITYALGYMEHESDASYARFFCYMDVFILSMLTLVLSGNFVFLIVGWAGVGLSSYLLIGFWYWRWTAVIAARKAFVMNVVGDIGMILGTFIVFVRFHQVTYTGVFAALPSHDTPALEAIAFLMLVGGVAKSAQLPLHTWLPDAMEGPTPVSALIHAATMVTAGVYLVGRLHPIYDVAHYAQDTVATVGAVTALFAATIAIVQTDIKKVLAYSTMSQIGYMFLGVGVAAYAAAFFHLMSHAFFKALLFMSGGNVIHGMKDEQDMRRYGGLLRQMPATAICFLIGSLALAGIIPFVGFWSKDMILGAAFSKPAGQFPVSMWAIGFVTAILTGFYTGRMWWISFAGKPSPDRPVERPHEAQAVMLAPVLILAVLATIGGFIQMTALHVNVTLIENFLAPAVGRITWSGGTLELEVTVATLILALAAFGLGYLIYVRRALPVWSRALPFLQRLLEHKYYFDELYDAIFVQTMNLSARGGDQLLEEPVVEGTPQGVGSAASSSAGILALAQSGYFRTYALIFLGGALVALIVLVAVRA